MCNLRNIQRWIFAVPLVLGFPLAQQARAEILQLNAVITAEVQEFISGDRGSFDSAFEEFGVTSATLPIQAAASLLPPEGIPITDFAALAITDFRDPAVSLFFNPGEFGLETNLYSRDPLISFTGDVVATETRRVLFSAAELGLFAGESETAVFSSVFASGAIIIWSEESARDLTGLSANLQLSVVQQLPDLEPTAVFDAGLTASGGPNGRVTVNTAGGLFAIVGSRELLPTPTGFGSGELIQELDGLGEVHVVIIPGQEFIYEYVGVPDVEFDLTARFEAGAVNLPDGTGIGAVYGRSFQALAQAIAQAVGSQSKGVVTQAAVNAALEDAEVPSPAAPSFPTVFAGNQGLCGALGPVFLSVTFAPLLVAGLVRRRR